MVHLKLWHESLGLWAKHGPTYKQKQKHANRAALQHDLDVRSSIRLRLSGEVHDFFCESEQPFCQYLSCKHHQLLCFWLFDLIFYYEIKIKLVILYQHHQL